MKKPIFFTLIVLFCIATAGLLIISTLFFSSVLGLLFNICCLGAAFYAYKLGGLTGLAKFFGFYWVITLTVISFAFLVGHMASAEEEPCPSGATGNTTYITEEGGKRTETIIVCKNGELVDKITRQYQT